MNLEAIGVVRSPFPDKFLVPRQSGLGEVEGEVRVAPAWRDATRGLEGASHLWILSHFDAASEPQARRRTQRRPPLLGGKAPLGVFATRAPHRPNPIGLTLVELLGIRVDRGTRETVLAVRGLDLRDGTPVLDLKPFHPTADVPTGRPAALAWLARIPQKAADAPEIEWSAQASRFAEEWTENARGEPREAWAPRNLKTWLERLLREAGDPRPGARRATRPGFKARVLADLDVHGEVLPGRVRIDEIRRWKP